MDLSIYYEEFQTVYGMGNFAVILMLCTTIFLCVRRVRDFINKDEYCNRVWKVAVLSVTYVFLFLVILCYYFRGPYLCKKDIDQKTIYGYEGSFEIIETTEGIYDRATILIDGEEISLNYFENNDYEVDLVKPGEYEGKLIYAQHSSKILYIEIYQSE